tara:strand:- start:40547 stop:41791 length:1245 start_codon:yes stop_codon:yes gene_type:complete
MYPSSIDTTPAPVEKDGLPNFPMQRCPFAPPKQYAEIRQQPGLSKIRMPDGSWAWIVTRHAEVKQVLGDVRFTTVPATPNYPMVAPARASLLRNEHPATLIRMDPPNHTKHRRMLSKEFMVKVVEGMKPYLEETIDRLLDEMEAQGGSCDFAEVFALALPTTVISHILGVPYEDQEFFHERALQKLDLKADPEVPVRAGREMREYLDELITRKLEADEPQNDLITRLLQNHMLTGDITREEALATIELLLMGGHETTANMIALGCLSLLENPDQKDELVADPSLVVNAVEEMLRFHTIVHYNGPRVALEDIEVGGTMIRKGDGVMALISAANRDPEAFENPDSFDIHRKAIHHVAFSYGVHQCLGQPLARAELQIVFTKLFQRFPKLKLAVPFEELEFRYDAFVYGVDKLPVTW